MKPLSLRLSTVRLLLCAALVGSTAGCQKRGPSPAMQVEPPPSESHSFPQQFGPAPARITLLNTEHGFVVIDFSGRVMPSIGTRLNVYRGDRRIGVVQITEPVRTRFATADILEGDVRVGDEAR